MCHSAISLDTEVPTTSYPVVVSNNLHCNELLTPQRPAKYKPNND